MECCYLSSNYHGLGWISWGERNASNTSKFEKKLIDRNENMREYEQNAPRKYHHWGHTKTTNTQKETNQ